MTPFRVYLAGPDVFLADAAAVARGKVGACAARGIVGVFPVDAEGSGSASGTFGQGVAIAQRNIELMRNCDAILANCTPFRSAHADLGTAFEIGFFAALGRPVFAYSSAAGDVAKRTRAVLGLDAAATADASGMAIEDFGHPDNLMLSGAVSLSHGNWEVVADGDPAAIAAFTQALDRLADLVKARAAA